MTAHPLDGVAPHALAVARDALGAWEEVNDWPDELVNRVADALVAHLNSNGYITHPTPVEPTDSFQVVVRTRVAVTSLIDRQAAPTVINQERIAHVDGRMVPAVARVLASTIADGISGALGVPGASRV